MMKRENLKITWGVLLVGLKKEWLTSHEVVELVNEYSEELACSENLLVELNVNEDDKKVILDLLKEKGKSEEKQAIKYWHQSALLTIEQSQKSIEEKLKDIALQWARFDYPEEWRAFIYYMPNEKVNSNEGVYQIFVDYLNNVPNR